VLPHPNIWFVRWAIRRKGELDYLLDLTGSTVGFCRSDRQQKHPMGQEVDEKALNSLFREGRSYTNWQPRPVSDQTVRDLYELLKWAPTSANASPARFAFLRSKEAKERLRPALAPLNVEKTITAPVTVIVTDKRVFRY
jgi:hypothetical protein